MESRPRKQDFSRVLKAEIHDALWMLGRQWQMDEFTGKDAGTGVLARVQIDHQKMDGLDRYNNSSPSAYNFASPLEPVIEAVSYNWSIKERLLMGKKWLSIMNKEATVTHSISSGQYTSLLNSFTSNPYPNGFKLHVPEPTISSSDQDTHAGADIFNSNVLKSFLAGSEFSNLLIDGGALFEALRNESSSTIDGVISGIVGTDAAFSSGYSVLWNGVDSFVKWVNAMYNLPTSGENWVPEQLEYKFDTYWPNEVASDQLKFPVKAYKGGHFDWNAFTQDLTVVAGTGLTYTAPTSFAQQMVLARSHFPGMPSSRWWEMEDGKVNFCNIDADTTDIAKIVLTQFALIYQDDWFLVPCKIPVGSYSSVKGIIVKDVFGVKSYIRNYSADVFHETAGVVDSISESTDEWKSWRWMDISANSNYISQYAPVGRLILPPVTKGVLESKPIESVLFMRDEMTNLVWGIEKIVPDNLGRGKDGQDAVNKFDVYLRKLRDSADDTIPVPSDPDAKLTYSLESTTVPENWIPLMAVHTSTPPSNRKIRYQRSAMPRIIDQYSPPSMIRPRTEILNYGLRNILIPDGTGTLQVDRIMYPQNYGFPAAPGFYQPLFINEEEIPKTGTLVQTAFKRARWFNGKVITWVGRKVQTGSGQGSSGLTFDNVRKLSS